MNIKMWLETAKKSTTAQAIAAMFSSGILIFLIGGIGTLIQGRFVTAEDLGYFKQFSIISGYLFIFHLGTFHAIERLYPYYIGKGDKKKAISLVEVGNSWMLVVSGILAAIFLIISIINFIDGNWKAGLGWLAQTYMIIKSLYGGFISATYRSGQDFKKMAKNRVIGPLFSIISWPIFLVQPYGALFLKNISGIFSTIKLYRNRPIKCKWRFSWKEWLELVKQGLPRFSASYIMSTGLDAIRATIVLAVFGIEGLGYWAFAWMLMLMAKQIPQSICAVYVPKIFKLYGKTSSVNKCIKLIKKPIIVGVLSTIFIVGIGMVGMIYIFPIVLPNYIISGNIICILLLSLPLSLIEMPATIFNAMNKIGVINICAIANAGTQVLTIGICLYFDQGLYSFAIGVFAGLLMRSIIIIILLKKYNYTEVTGIVEV
jgi:O-antigen/teichoic acid export membrane protein